MTEIFVFGSNLAGFHGAGAAAEAVKRHGAVMNRGHGLHGNSYAIPTKNQFLVSLTLPTVEKYIKTFIQFAKDNQEYTFKVTQIGCGFAGFTGDEIAPLFREAPANCTFDSAWKQYLGESKKYWGTYDDQKNKRLVTRRA